MNPPTEDDPLARDLADMLWRIEGNYHREGAGPGSRFEGETLQAVQVRGVLQALADAGRLLPSKGETTEEWALRDSVGRVRLEDGGPSGSRALINGLVAQWPGSSAARRVIRSWPDGSRWTGPWEAVDG